MLMTDPIETQSTRPIRLALTADRADKVLAAASRRSPYGPAWIEPEALPDGDAERLELAEAMLARAGRLHAKVTGREQVRVGAVAEAGGWDPYDLARALAAGHDGAPAREDAGGAAPVAMDGAVPSDGARAVPFERVRRERVEFLLPGVPAGMVTVLAGHAGLGKSMHKARWAADVSTGSAMLGREPAGVLLLDGEDPPPVTRGRLEAAGADLSRVMAVELRRDGHESGVVLPDDLPAVEAVVAEHDIGLVVVDPINAFTAGSIDSWKDTSTRRLLGPLTEMARRTGAAVVLVMHLGKAERAEALHRIGGSVAYGAAARSVFMLDRDPDDPDGELGAGRVLLHVKSNVGALRRTELLRVEPFELEDGESTARIVAAGSSPYSASEVFAMNAKRGRGASKLSEAKELVGDVLADGDWHERSEVWDACDAAGISEPTMKRAAGPDGLGVETENTKTVPRRTLWRLRPVGSSPGDPTGERTSELTGRDRSLEPNARVTDPQSAQHERYEPTAAGARRPARSNPFTNRRSAHIASSPATRSSEAMSTGDAACFKSLTKSTINPEEVGQ
jgi:hypothetical protein